MPKRVLTGVVTGDKMAKTRRVEIKRLVKHPKYKKYVRRRTVCYAHDEQNESAVGDLVEIKESRPMSKLKRWELIRVVEKSTAVDVAALRAARKHAASEAENEAIEAAHGGDAEAPKA
ncbi:30S ribosomal protein S17 [Rosistilla oblonga]|uniref:Small ribosomal subunit protein uS17 n=1 Tax=Rosistilla oblonga TaxID=2527990 RepID=A0A518IW14_9BACT|nr:30S ribosomal protein S17 [Rosistilla oblonga]QDV57278.1 30S ribosomal protein S17 [Rosistilla oblonga]